MVAPNKRILHDTKELRIWASQAANALARATHPKSKLNEKDFKHKHKRMLKAFKKLMNDEADYLLKKLKVEREKVTDVWNRKMDDEIVDHYGKIIQFGLWVEKKK